MIFTHQVSDDFSFLVDGYWSSWEDWGKCSETCGDGLQTRERSCTFPYPRNQGKTCPGNPMEVRSCNEQACQGTNNILIFSNKVIAYLAYILLLYVSTT